jgi:Flp pilus assembly protein TadG
VGRTVEAANARRDRRRDQGAAAVEFVLVLPVLLLLIFGIVDFGRMLNAQIVVTEAAREGARAAALIDQAAGEDRIDQIAGVALGDVDPTVTPCPESPGEDDNAKATVEYTFGFVTPLGVFIGDGGSITLTGESVMPCLN